MSEEKEVTSTEETTEEVAETTTTEETDSSAEAEVAEDLDQVRKDAKAFKDQKLRAEKAEAELKKLKGAPKGTTVQDTTAPNYAALEQRTIRAELAANGIKSKPEQDFVISAAKRLGVDPSEAANDSIVVARLEKMREDAKTKDATPAPTRGGGSHRNSGKLPDFSKMSNAEFDAWEKKNR